MKTFILSYCFNGVFHQEKIKNVGDCLGSLFLVAGFNEISNVTISGIKK